PSAAAVQSYSISATATSGVNPALSATGFATESIIAGLSVTVSTNMSTYVTGDTVVISVLLRLGTAPITGTKVTIVMTKPNGSTQKWSPSTDANGLAKTSFKIGSSFPRGTAVVTATATKTGLTGSGSASFIVE